MKKTITILLIFFALKSQSQTMCVQNNCVDTVYNPVNSLPIIGKVLSSVYPITYHGWSFVSGPSPVTVPVGDSVWVTLPSAGNYVFQYKATDTKGNVYTGTDKICVIPFTVTSTTVYYTDSTNAQSKPIQRVVIKYSNGSIKTLFMP